MKVLKILMLCLVLTVPLSGCFEDKFRYFCQNPDNFYKEQCQKPRCQFTQTCPEYLVAPVLEKQIEQTRPASEPTPVR